VNNDQLAIVGSFTEVGGHALRASSMHSAI
jgi:hypothetical protein